MKKNVMTEEEFELACQDIIQKYSEQLDIRIKIDKECIDSHNQSIKKVRNYKSKLLTYAQCPKCFGWTIQREYIPWQAQNLEDLMDNREKYLKYQVYGYVLSAYYPENVNIASKLFSRAYFRGGWPFYPVIGAVVGAFFNWTIAAILGALGLAVGIFVCKKNRPTYKKYGEVLKGKKLAVEYVKKAIEDLPEEEKQKIHIIKCNLDRQKSCSDGEKMKLAKLNAEIDALSRPSRSTSQSPSSSQTAQTDGANGRKEVTDEYGRTQGYLEGGKLYNDKSDVVGHVDNDGRVYDSDYHRIGEVESDGKITKYK